MFQVGSFMLFPLLCLLTSVVNGALENPGFWDVSQEELSKLVDASLEHLRPFRDMGSIAELCNVLPGWQAETARKLTNASVAILDEALLCSDFPSTCSMSKADRESWFLDQAAWFSDVHLATNLDTVPYDPDSSKAARRACSGHRALLVPTTSSDEQSPLFVDVKGAGARRPRAHSRSKRIDHSDGKVALFDAILEYLNEKTISSVVDYHAEKHKGDTSHSFHTVGSYGVISLGFEFQWTDENDKVHFYPAGALVRQASRRHPTVYGFMHPPEASMLEQILNLYGLSSDTASKNDHLFRLLPNPHCFRINLQGTVEPRSVADFNSFYYDTRPWPRPKDACLVHWAGTHIQLETPLWKNGINEGNARSRSFFKAELEELPDLDDFPSWPARRASNVRMMRIYNVSTEWWHGHVGTDSIQSAVGQGLMSFVDDAHVETAVPGRTINVEL